MTVAITVTEAIGWTLLVLLLLGMVGAAVALDRTAWPTPVGDEPTYLMAAYSLGRDFDLRYTAGEVERFRRVWRRPPDGLILQSPDGGGHLYYAKPLLYPALLAPFARLMPVRGPFLANGLALAAMGLCLAWGLRPALGEAAPWWAGALVFVSALPVYVFWAHPDLLLAALAVGGLALVFGPAGEPGREAVRFAAAGALLALVGLGRPWYAGLLLAGAVALPRGRWRRLLGWYAAGAALALVATLGLEWLARGDWSSYSGERVSYASATSFPAGDGSAAERVRWSARVLEEGPGSWTAPGRRFPFPLTPELWGWNAVYFLVGRNVGLLPYFPSLLLLFLSARGRGGRWMLATAFLFAAAGFLASRPFNFYGGGGAIANRYVLPVIPALWFLCARQRSAIWAPGMALLAAPLLLPLWTGGATYPFPENAAHPWVSAVAQRWLPYETTQSHLKPAGREDFVHNGLWIKPLTPGLEPREDRIAVRGGEERLELLAGSHTPLGVALCYRTAVAAASAVLLEYQGRAAQPIDGEPGRYRVSLGGPSAHHPMWWTPEPWSLYRLSLRSTASAQIGADAWITIDPACPPS